MTINKLVGLAAFTTDMSLGSIQILLEIVERLLLTSGGLESGGYPQKKSSLKNSSGSLPLFFVFIS